MKAKYIVALILMLVGTNLFTYATARYWTTQHVLTRAHTRVMDIFMKQKVGEQSIDQSLDRQILMAMANAGGAYDWWNDGLLYWGAAIVLILSGLAVTRYEPRKKDAG